jgi:hypothetical protein
MSWENIVLLDPSVKPACLKNTFNKHALNQRKKMCSYFWRLAGSSIHLIGTLTNNNPRIVGGKNVRLEKLKKTGLQAIEVDVATDGEALERYPDVNEFDLFVLSTNAVFSRSTQSFITRAFNASFSFSRALTSNVCICALSAG